jgi:3D (Asp-Asp-Asp) domain-containing protein
MMCDRGFCLHENKLMEGLKAKPNRVFSLKLVKRIIVSLIVVLIFEFFLFPMPTLASEIKANQLPDESLETQVNEYAYIKQIINGLPDNQELEVAWSTYRSITSYNSEVSQTDGAPCITANGFNVCEHGIEDTIAANWLKFGTRVRIPDLFGDRIFVVRDRMNKRYPDRADVWLIDKVEAKKFGVRIAKIEILEGH